VLDPVLLHNANRSDGSGCSAETHEGWLDPRAVVTACFVLAMCDRDSGVPAWRCQSSDSRLAAEQRRVFNEAALIGEYDGLDTVA
jgi:hypothetical protein